MILVIRRLRLRLMRMSAVSVFSVVIFLQSSVLVSAHHSRAGVYESEDNAITMEGVVAEWRWRNPHVFLLWDVTDEEGNVVRWTGELSSVISMRSEGLRRDTFKAGQEITITGVPALSGAPQTEIVKVVMADGRILVDRSDD